MSGFEIELPSSPDPLGDEEPSDSAPVPPSTTRRLLQSTASSRFSARPGTSPRKRMFALDVGNEMTPQTIYVTVEAGQDGPATKASTVGSSVRRRLFGSPTPQPSPQRRVRTTTTTVPLRGLTDDEGGPTPRRRRRSSTGRPGTPAATSPKKKKRGTPTPKATKKSPKKPRPSRRPSNDVDILQSGMPATTPRRRGRPPKRKLPEDPTEQDDPSATQTLPRKKGGRRRESLGPDDMDVYLNQSVAEAENADSGDNSNNNNNNEEPVSDARLKDEWVAVQAEEDGDLWLDMSDPPAADDQQEARAVDGAMLLESADAPLSDRMGYNLDDERALLGGLDDYAPMMENDDGSDVKSRHSEPASNAPHNPDELDYQGPLPGEPDDYAPIVEQDDRSDAQSQRSEQEGGFRDPTDFRDELGYQGSLSGESDHHALILDQEDRSDGQSQRSERSAAFRDPADFRDELDHTMDAESFTMIGLESMQCFRAPTNAETSDPAELGEDTSLFINKTLDSLRQEIAESEGEEVDVLVSRGQTPAGSESETQAPTNLSARIRLRVSQSPPQRLSRQVSRSPERTESVAGSSSQGGRHKHARSPAQTVNTSNAKARCKEDEVTGDEDSFSDIPAEVLAAVQPDENWQHKVLAHNQQEVAWTASLNVACEHSDASSDQQKHDRTDSAHATPSYHDGSLADGDQDVSQQSASRSAKSHRSNQPVNRDSPPQSLMSRTDSNRLLTPDATTSSSTQSPSAQQDGVNGVEGPVVSNDVGSSPPEITSFVEHNEQASLLPRRKSDTPANAGPEIHVDHVQERHTVAAVLQPALLGGHRPTLSPVVRIGRTLQNILSDPPSPSGASSVLGSPFKGSVRNSSPLDAPAGDEASHSGTKSEITQQPAEARPKSPGKSWAMALAPISQIKSLVTQGAHLFTSPRVKVSQDMEDPFAPSSPTLDKALDNTRNSAFMDRIRQASRERSRPSSRVGKRAAATDSTATRQAANATSTPRFGVTGLDRPSSSRSVGSEAFQRARQQRVAAPGGHDGMQDEYTDELVSQGICLPRLDEPSSDATIPQEPEHGIDGAENEDVEMEEQEQIREDSSTQRREPDDTDFSSDAVDVERDEQQCAVDGPLTSSVQPPRLTQSEAGAGEDDVERDEKATNLDDAPIDATFADDEDDEDIWAIEADRTASSPQFAASQQDTSALFRKSELSVDWGTRSTNSQAAVPPVRSPAFAFRRSRHELSPEDLEEYSLVDLHSDTPTQPSAEKAAPEQQTQSKNVDLSDFFSSSPNFIERQRRAKKASLARSAAQMATETTQVAYPDLDGQTEDAGTLSHLLLPNATRSTTEIPSPGLGASHKARASSSATPEQARHRVPGQRMTPQRAQNDAALFESWSVSSRAPTERPPTSEASITPRTAAPLSRDPPSFESPGLRPLPGRAASPSKSCLRSPLKAKTPGRLVDFTSSTASVTAPLQAVANAQSYTSAAAASSGGLFGPSFPGKENQTAAQNPTSTRTSPQTLASSQEDAAAAPASNTGLFASLFPGKNQTAVQNAISDRTSPQPRPLPQTQPQTQQQEQQQQQQQERQRQRQRQRQANETSLSQTGWCREHWLYLDDLWKEYQHSPREFQRRHSHAVMVSPSKRPSSSLLGKVVSNQGESVELRQMHLDVVDAFKKEVGGWDETTLAKRLFALIVGAERRRSRLVPRNC